MAEDKKIIVFALAHEEYGVEVDKVKTIERMQPMTRVPKTPAFVKGVINLRGVVVPVIDLRSRFGLPETEYSDNTRVIIVAVNELEVGLIVDSANDVIDLNEDNIENPPEVVGGIKAKYLHGIAKIGEDRLLVLMNLEQVLNRDEIIQLEKIEA
ncbi:chemotaxis protein CheW [Paenibacillus chitinolyticus]|uniref:Chemotaxis protein CheW n=1 Tax=Paenibacillus chitinolyticus TaxID=79263 RepID=A0A410X048_9BACL|nr:chemotaxis protein CheW [Paenibacillus chitinolyticus]MCY9592940.1 chemotaxis protein CheW [Paenibacillus chitinolyticus]MCY9595867.1 chemotaxis protein CheW [Paenibacillus chitinolyticus]QAV20066.1 chemotaxis protein CheW [Paenibacillus chitinolyticus]GKS10004.1 chemotaxis protein CheW [Paenibacillus chitinolyticus]